MTWIRKLAWLLVFHAVTHIDPETGIIPTLKKAFGIDVEPGHDMYCAWTALFDLKKPSKLIARSKGPILIPRRKHEISFEGKRVIFPTGIVQDLNNKDVLLFNGVGDQFVSVKKIALREMMRSLS